MPAGLPGRFHFTLRVWLRRLVGWVRGGWYRLVRRPLGYLAWTLWCRLDWVPDNILSRRNALARLGELTLIQAPPTLVSHFVQDEDVMRKWFVWPGDWDLRVEPVERHIRYQLMADVWAHRDRLQDSATLREFNSRLQAGRPVELFKANMRLDSPERVLAFLQGQLDLFRSLARDGFRPELAPDELKVAIGRNGEIIKANGGRKRLMASRILGLERIPLRIAYVHRDWLLRHRGPGEHRGDAVRAALRAVRAAIVDTAATPYTGGRR
ncbi:MAG: hypothetical protein R6W80_00305 [Haliea sp.]